MECMLNRSATRVHIDVHTTRHTDAARQVDAPRRTYATRHTHTVLAMVPLIVLAMVPLIVLVMVLDIFTAHHVPVTRTVVYDEISVAAHGENLVYAAPPPLSFMPIEEPKLVMHTADSPIKLSAAECKDVDMTTPKGKGVIHSRREMDDNELAARRLPPLFVADLGLVANRVFAQAKRTNWDITCPDGHQIAREYKYLVGPCGCFFICTRRT